MIKARILISTAVFALLTLAASIRAVLFSQTKFLFQAQRIAPLAAYICAPSLVGTDTC